MTTKSARTTKTKQDEYSQQFAKRLRAARGDMPQSELISRLREQGLELTQARMSHYETGRNYPDPPILAALAAVLGVSADWLLGLTSEMLSVNELMGGYEERLASATGEQRINKVMRRLPKEKQQQVLSFAEYLLSIEQKNISEDNLAAWRAASEVLEAKLGAEGVADYLALLDARAPDIAAVLRQSSFPKKKLIQE